MRCAGRRASLVPRASRGARPTAVGCFKSRAVHRPPPTRSASIRSASVSTPLRGKECAMLLSRRVSPLLLCLLATGCTPTSQVPLPAPEPPLVAATRVAEPSPPPPVVDVPMPLPLPAQLQPLPRAL